MSFLIRELRENDKEHWLELWSEYLTFYKSTLSETQTELTWERLLNPQFNLYGLVAESGGEVVGLTHFLFRPSTWAENDYCYLEDLFVDPSVRGHGCGRTLIEAVVERAKVKKSKRVYWTTQNSNSQARVLYDSFGFPSEFVQYRIPLDS